MTNLRLQSAPPTVLSRVRSALMNAEAAIARAASLVRRGGHGQSVRLLQAGPHRPAIHVLLVPGLGWVTWQSERGGLELPGTYRGGLSARQVLALMPDDTAREALRAAIAGRVDTSVPLADVTVLVRTTLGTTRELQPLAYPSPAAFFWDLTGPSGNHNRAHDRNRSRIRDVRAYCGNHEIPLSFIADWGHWTDEQRALLDTLPT